MFRSVKFRISVGSRSFNGDDGVMEILRHRRLFSRDKGSSDAEDESLKSTLAPSGIPGSGAGRGGGDGGSVRAAGGGLGKMAASREESYFQNASPSRANVALAQILRVEMNSCGPPTAMPSGCGFGLGKLAVTHEDAYFERKTMEDLERLHEEMKNELEAAGKRSELERDRDRRVEKKMKELANNLRDIIDEGKKQ